MEIAGCKVNSPDSRHSTMTDTEEEYEVIPIEADVSVENDEFEPAPDEDEEYEVEEILNKRIKKGETEYLVKWKGRCNLFYLLFCSLKCPGQAGTCPNTTPGSTVTTWGIMLWRPSENMKSNYNSRKL